MEFINQAVLSCVPKNTMRLLDVGCGNGWLGREVKKNGSCHVIGITISQEESALAFQCLDRVITADINNFDTSELGEFDCIVCSHVLEHLYQPQVFLSKIRNNLVAGGFLIAAVPNILLWKIRWQFLRGRFKYIDNTATDRGHFRFFDWQGAHELLEQNGYKIIMSRAQGNFPLPVIRRFLPKAVSSWFDRTAQKYLPNFFGVQFILVALKCQK